MLPPSWASPTPHTSNADDDAWHERLVSYYSRFGFRPVRVVRGDSLGDLPHMLVWGGAGTVSALGSLRAGPPVDGWAARLRFKAVE